MYMFVCPSVTWLLQFKQWSWLKLLRFYSVSPGNYSWWYYHVFGGVIIDGVWIGYWIYWHTYTHHSELQVITALISTLYKLLHVKSSSVCNVSKNRSLATASKSVDSSASRAHVVTLRRISGNWTHSAGLGPSLYGLRADPTENTASNSFCIVFMGACLAIALISLMCLPAVTKQRTFLLSIIPQQRRYTLQYVQATSGSVAICTVQISWSSYVIRWQITCVAEKATLNNKDLIYDFP
jgi:hypothetical protein